MNNISLQTSGPIVPGGLLKGIQLQDDVNSGGSRAGKSSNDGGKDRKLTQKFNGTKPN
jgi:hypothetical protein